MRVLWIQHPECDYGANMAYNGMCEILGDRNVFDYPLKWSYHGTVDHYSIPGIENGMTAPTPWSVNADIAYKDRSDQFGEVVRMLRNGDFSFVVVESLRERALHYYEGLKSAIDDAGIPVIALDGEDYQEIDWRKVNRVRPRVLLKRELRKSRYSSHDFTAAEGYRVIGFPFSACNLALAACIAKWIESGDLNRSAVTFMCGVTNPVRKHVAEALQHAFPYTSYVATNDVGWSADRPLLPWDAYINKMLNSTISVSCLGWGNDTVRFWEIPTVSCLASQDVGLHYENPLVPWEHYIPFTNEHDVVPALQSALSDIDSLYAMRNRCMNHVAVHHTNRARAEKIVALAKEYGAHDTA